MACVASARSAGVRRRGLAAAAPKKGGAGKGKKDSGAAQAAAGPGDFPIDDMYPELKLGELQAADLPEWAVEEYKSVYEGPKLADRPPPLPGQEDRKYFKVLRRQKIKDNNERRALGIQ